jgi:tetratricopeptide (TPR) repeat protein
MGQRAGGLFAMAVIALGGLVWARQTRQAEQAEALLDEAERLLRAPLDQAPAFEDVRAREARELVARAADLDASERAEQLTAEVRAVQQLQKGEPRAARHELSDVRGAELPARRVLLAAIELADRQLSAAEVLLEGVLAHDPKDLRALALASDVARAQGRADRALELAERGVAIHASRPLYERRGLAHELGGDLEAARDDLERAASLDSRPTAPLLHLGRVLRALGDIRGAVLAFQAASQRNPREAEAWLGSGICRAQLGDGVGARVDLERAEELAPTRADPLIALGDLDVAEGAIASAERRYRAATKLDPEHALGWLKLGNGLMRASKQPEAVAAFRRAIELTPELAAAHNGLGAALHSQGESSAAVAELELAAKLDPSDPNPLRNLARVHRQAGDRARADRALLRAQDLGSADASILQPTAAEAPRANTASATH